MKCERCGKETKSNKDTVCYDCQWEEYVAHVLASRT